MRGIFSANNKVGQEFIIETNSSSGTTFDPVVQMNGSKRASWDLGEGGSYFAGNSVSYTYPNSSTKTIKLRTNRLTDVVSLNMQDDNIVGVLNLSAFTNCGAFNFNTNAGLTGLTIPPSNTTIFSVFNISSCNIYGRVDLSGYTNLGGSINLSNNINITGVTFPISSRGISLFSIGYNNFTDDLVISGLTGMGGIIQINDIKSSNIIFPNSSSNITSFNMNTCKFLNSVNLTSLSGLGGSVVLQGNTGVTSYTLANNSRPITNLSITLSPLVTSLDLSPLSGVSGLINVSNDTSLVSLTLPSVFGGPVTLLSVAGCSLPASVVNYVLYTIDNAGWTNGTLYADGGTNSAPDGSSGGYNGTASTLSLISKGWSITTN